MDKGNSIILTGFMGSGKTSLGKAVSKKLQLPFLDTDRLIVDREGISINEIFAEKGEAYFRDLETRTIQELIDRKGDYVLSVGGGLPMKAENRPILKQLGCVIYLKTSLEKVTDILERYRELFQITKDTLQIINTEQDKHTARIGITEERVLNLLNKYGQLSIQVKKLADNAIYEADNG